MRAVVVILSLFAVALCAPTGEKANLLDIDDNDIRVKRAKEIMMFGNQQNEQQKDKSKRTDPSDNIDHNGYIVAKEPIDLETDESDNTNVAEETVTDIQEENGNEIDDSAETEQQESQEIESTEQDAVESTEIDTSDDDTALEPSRDDALNEDDQISFEDYLKELEKMQGEKNIAPYFNSLLKDTRDPYWNQDAYRYYNNYNSPYNNYQRYRRSQAQAMKNMRFPMLKRNHRTKRQAYYVPDYLPYEDRLLETPYNKYPMTEEDLAELLDVLDDARVYDDGVYLSPYEGYAPYDDMDNLEFDSPIYVPKRQAGLTFVPGIKRNKDFYPYYIEPDTHFGAFVPDKRSMRDEADSYNEYERLMELAAALRSNYYPEDYLETYRRRK